MIDLLTVHILPAALSLLPMRMASDRATAMLLAIALQESGVKVRHQVGGPALGFWQFELAGVRGVMEHPLTRDHLKAVLRILRYDTPTPFGLHSALEHNDVLAACFARLLLWTDPRSLPEAGQSEAGYQVYLSTWRPGRPRPEPWAGHYAEAWDRTRTPLPGLRA